MDITLNDVAALIDAAKSPGYFANQLETSLSPLFDKLAAVESGAEKFTINDLFKFDKNKQRKLTGRYEKALDKFLLGFESKMDMFAGRGANPKTPRNPHTNPFDTTPLMRQRSIANIPALKKNTVEDVGEPIPVHIETINEELLKKLGAMRPVVEKATEKKQEDKGDKKDTKSSGGFLSKLMRAGLPVVALAALAAGGALLYQGLLTDGKLKGLIKLMGQSIMQYGVRILKPIFNFIKTGIVKVGAGLAKSPFIKKILASKFGGLLRFAGKGMKFTSKLIPGLGALISFAFAYTRFKANDALGGVLEIAAGISSFFPGIGSAIAGGINILLAARDLTTTRVQRSNQSINLLGGLTKWLAKNKYLKAIGGFFGGVFDFFSAKSGDDIDRAVARIKENGMGVVYTFFPVLVPLLTLWDWLSSPKALEFGQKVAFKSVEFGQFLWENMGKAWDHLWNYVSNMWGHIKDSVFFRKIELKMNIGWINVQKAFAMVVNVTSLFQRKMLSGILNTVEKLKPFLGGALFKLRGFDKLIDDLQGSSMVKGIDTSELDKEYVAEMGKLYDLNTEERVKREQERRRKDDEAAERRNDKLIGAIGESAAANISATQQNTQAVMAGVAANNAPSREGGNTTNMFNVDGGNASNRVRDMAYKDAYVGYAY